MKRLEKTMANEVNSAKGFDILKQQLQKAGVKEEVKEEDINSIMDTLQDENIELTGENFDAALKSYYGIDEADTSLIETINSVAELDGDNSTISADDLNKQLEKLESSETVNIGKFDVTSETYDAVKTEILNEIEQKKQALQDDKDNRGVITSITSGIAGLFGGGDTKANKEIEALERAVQSLETNPAKLATVYQTVMGKPLDTDSLSDIEEANEFCSSLSNDAKSMVVDVLSSQLDLVEQGFDDTKSHNGWLSGLWDGVKNFTGIGASSNKTQTEINNARKELEEAKGDPQKLAIAYKNITGKELTPEEYQKLYNGETSLMADSKAAQKVEKYQDGQQMVTDVVADVAVGFVAAAAVAAAPFTAGASLAVGAAVGAGVGAVVKPAIKASDALTGGREYTLKDLGYDAATGAVGGAVSGATAGFGKAATNGVGIAGKLYSAGSTAVSKASGLPFLGKVMGAGSRVASTKLGSAAVNAAKTGAKRYVTGFAAGSTDAAARAVLEGRADEALSDALRQGNAAGLGSVVIGAAGDAGKKVFSKAGSKISKVGSKAKDAAGKAGSKTKDAAKKVGSKIKSKFTKGAADVADDAAKVGSNAADDIAENVSKAASDAPSKFNSLDEATQKQQELWEEASKYADAGEEIPESLTKELNDTTNEIEKLKAQSKATSNADGTIKNQDTTPQSRPQSLKTDKTSTVEAGKEYSLDGNAKIKIGDSTFELDDAFGDLDNGTYTIGRDAGCDIQIDDPAMSKKHLQVTKTDDGYVIKDLNSTNGTKVLSANDFAFENSIKNASSTEDFQKLADEEYSRLRGTGKNKVDYGKNNFRSNRSRQKLQDIVTNGNNKEVKIKRYGENETWSARAKQGCTFSEPVDRISLNVKGDPDLIKELDYLMTHGKYFDSKTGKWIQIKADDLSDFYYKTPTDVSAHWGSREDPITMYFMDELSDETKDAISEITKKYARGTINGAENTATPWMMAEASPTKTMVKELTQKAQKLNLNLAQAIAKDASGSGLLSAGKYRAYLKILNSL